jgi:NAD(P)H-nitrite reductase large subunit
MPHKWPASRISIDPSCGENVCQTIRECGIQILFGSWAMGIDQGKQRLQVELNSGAKLDADAVIVGKGVRPNIDLLEGSHVAANTGILVDECMQTSVDNIYAVGDVTESINLVSGERQIIATWPNACNQGRAAGANMAGKKQSFSSLNMNVCSFLGNAVASVGITKPNKNYQAEVRQNIEQGFYRKLVWNQYDELVGAVLMGKIADIGILTHMIKNRIIVPEAKRKRMAISSIAYADHFTDRVQHRI